MTVNVDKDTYDFIQYVKDKKGQKTIKQAAWWIALNNTEDLYTEFLLNDTKN